MYTVKRGIIMAAGIGKRLQPITFNTPKPLIKVNGVRMIESIINGLHKNNIHEIYIVVGYLKEQFSFLIKKYKNITLIENPWYDKCNNISSLYVARNFIKNALIIDGDQIIYNDSILTNHFEKSAYNAVFINKKTNEWLMQTLNNKIISCSRTGGKNGWQLYSISRWTEDDGKKLKSHLEYEFEKKHNSQIYWDDIPMFLHFKDYDLNIIPMNKHDIIEIDTLNELIKIDNSYYRYLNEVNNDD